MTLFDVGIGLVDGMLLEPLDFVGDVPSRLPQVLQLVALLPGSPDTFDGVPPIEVEMPRHLDALDVMTASIAAMRPLGVVGRMIYEVMGRDSIALNKFFSGHVSAPKPASLALGMRSTGVGHAVLSVVNNITPITFYLHRKPPNRNRAIFFSNFFCSTILIG